MTTTQHITDRLRNLGATVRDNATPEELSAAIDTLEASRRIGSASVVQDSPVNIGRIVSSLSFQPYDSSEQIRQRSLERAQLIEKTRGTLLPWISNTNTVAPDLKRITALQTSIGEFAKRLMPLRQFSTVLGGVALEGTDEVVVPFYDLESAASVDFDESDGYLTGDTATSSRKVTISKRKYQGLSWSSKEFSRLPLLNIQALAQNKARKLAVDVWLDVLSLITSSNFPTVAHTGVASAFTADAVAALKLAAKTWPEYGRSLTVESTYDSYLIRDDAIQSAMASGSAAALREGKAGQTLFGFEYFESPSIPGNSENLTGWISFVSAILFAQAPITPTTEVLKNLSRYEVVTDPQTGATFEYRSWGNPDNDQSKEVIECNYGFEVGNAAALQRIRSAAP